MLVLATITFSSLPLNGQLRSNDGPGDDIIPIIILGGEWNTVIVFNNTNDLPVEFPLSFFSQGKPWAPPLKGGGNSSMYTIDIPARGTRRLEFDYSGDTVVGFGTIDVPCNFGPGQYCAGVGVYTLLRNHNSARAQDFEVAYQLGSTLAPSPQSFLFDQTDSAQIVLNLTNYCNYSFCTTATVTIQVFDETGQQFYLNTVNVAPRSVTIVNIAQLSSQTWNRAGMIRLLGTNYIVVTGHRVNATGSFTALYSYDYNF
jgi:hypothetical protein